MTFNGFSGAIQQLHELRCLGDMPYHCKHVIEEVINVLLMDTQEIRHGHWIDHFDDLVPEDSFECSECGSLIKQSHDCDGIYHFDNYCKNCGAKMDEVEK